MLLSFPAIHFTPDRLGSGPGRGAMKSAEAKDIVLILMAAGQPEVARSLVDFTSPDGDPAKFRISGKAAGHPPF
jgi:hypothetical protein